MRNRLPIQLTIAALLLLSLPAFAATASLSVPPLDPRFQLPFNLDFDHAPPIFAGWEQGHPDDPLGATFDAAGLLFFQFHRLGGLEAQFFEGDNNFENRLKLSPDPVTRARFDAEIQKAQAAAHARLAINAKDKDALFAMTLT